MRLLGLEGSGLRTSHVFTMRAPRLHTWSVRSCDSGVYISHVFTMRAPRLHTWSIRSCDSGVYISPVFTMRAPRLHTWSVRSCDSGSRSLTCSLCVLLAFTRGLFALVTRGLDLSRVHYACSSPSHVVYLILWLEGYRSKLIDTSASRDSNSGLTNLVQRTKGQGLKAEG